MPKKKDSLLNVNLSVSATQNSDGTWRNLTTTYSQGVTEPPSPGVVGANGDIDLSRFQDPDGQYGPATDIIITLSNCNVVDKFGNSLNMIYAPQGNNQITFTGRDAASQFVRAVGSGSNIAVAFTDTDTDSGDYHYCLNLWGYEDGHRPPEGYPLPLDPKIVNPG